MRKLSARLAALIGLVAAMALVALGPASAQEDGEGPVIVAFDLLLSGANEIGPDGSRGVGDPDATGSARVQLVGESTICWSIAVENIPLPAIGAHIHPGQVQQNGPVAVPLSNPDLDGVSIGCTAVDPAIVAAIAAEPRAYYLNVHTTEFPAGALRGQLVHPMCFVGPDAPPLPATIAGAGLLIGTNGPDVIVGSDGPDTIVALDGDDALCGEGGDDVLDGGFGNDTVVGDSDALPPFLPAGNDTLIGSDGDDVLAGLGGDDTILAGAGNDLLIGFGGNDQLFGEDGDDTAFGGPGDDAIFGGPGNDMLWGNFGSDSIHGGAGDDEIDGDNPFAEGPPGGPTESPDATDTCLAGDGDNDQVFNCELGSTSTPREPAGAPTGPVTPPPVA